MARRAGMPEDLIQDAKEICSTLTSKLKEKKKHNNERYAELASCFQLAQRLLSLKNSTLDADGLRSYLKNLKQQYVNVEQSQPAEVSQSTEQSQTVKQQQQQQPEASQ
jgi:hypothetical protein